MNYKINLLEFYFEKYGKHKMKVKNKYQKTKIYILFNEKCGI